MTTYHIYLDGEHECELQTENAATIEMKRISEFYPGKTVHVDEHRTIAHYYTPINDPRA